VPHEHRLLPRLDLGAEPRACFDELLGFCDPAQVRGPTSSPATLLPEAIPWGTNVIFRPDGLHITRFGATRPGIEQPHHRP
jgi:hypothetical protein